jgi:hypothetical protein
VYLQAVAEIDLERPDDMRAALTWTPDRRRSRGSISRLRATRSPLTR